MHLAIGAARAVPAWRAAGHIGGFGAQIPWNPARVSAKARRMTPHTVVLIAGDGIGPEVSAAVLEVLDAAKAPLEFEERFAGVAALDRGLQDVLPEETQKAICEHHVALKGPCTTPVGKGFSSVNVTLGALDEPGDAAQSPARNARR